MNSDILVSRLQKIGWKDFAPGKFVKVDFDQIGHVKIAKNNWFVLIKSISLLNADEIEFWNNTYQHFLKKTLSGMFSSGKYFILILLVDSIDGDTLDLITQENKPALFVPPQKITNGGGYALMLVKDRNQIFMPKAVKLWDVLHASEFTNQTNQVLHEHKNSLVVTGK